MNDLVPIFVIGIISWSIYKIFDLFVRRNERMALIEKINPETTGNIDLTKLGGILNPPTSYRFTALKWGLFAFGLGAGMFISFFIYINCPMAQEDWHLNNLLQGALALMGGGIGLFSAFLIEMTMRNRKE